MVTFRAATVSLAKEAIAASAGSACASKNPEPSHVLRAMGVPQTAIHGIIRFSLGRYNTEEKIEYILLEKLPLIIQRLRDLSPIWPQEKRAAG